VEEFRQRCRQSEVIHTVFSENNQRNFPEIAMRKILSPRNIFRKFVHLIILLIVIIGALFVSSEIYVSIRETKKFGTLPDQGGRFIDTKHGKIYIIERGPEDGIPVLFAHGTAAWSGLWLPTLETVGQHSYRAIAFDMPPFGYSEYPADGSYSRQDLAQTTLALIEALEIRPIMVAHSIGAGPASEAVLTKPDAFSGYVIVAGAIGLREDQNSTRIPMILSNESARRIITGATASNPILTGVFLRNFINIKDAATPEIVKVLRQPISREGYTAAVAQWLPQLFETPRHARSTQPIEWQKLNLPTQIIWGDQDSVTPLPQAKNLAALIPAAELITMAGIGHIPQIEAPELFQEKLLSTIANISLFEHDTAPDSTRTIQIHCGPNDSKD